MIGGQAETSERAELLEQFAIETEQHIEQLEPLLLAAEWDQPDSAAVGAMFRCFHSVKGLSRLLELRGLEAVAHHAETLLGRVRAGLLVFTPAVQELLLAALDAMRDLRCHGIATGQDTAPPTPLLLRLQAQAETTDQPVAMAAIPVVPSDPPLHEDADTLSYFAEMLAEGLPNLAVLAGGPGDANQAAEDLATLSRAAERLQLRGLQRRLAGVTQGGNAPDIIVERLAALVVDARLLSQAIGQETGADFLAQGIGPGLRRARASAARRLSEDLTNEPDALMDRARRLWRLSLAVAPADDTASLILQAVEAFPWPEASTIPPLLQGLAGMLAEDLHRSDGNASDMLGLAASNLRLALATLASPAAPVQKVLTDRGIDLARLGSLGPAAQANLVRAFEGGAQQLLAGVLPVPLDDAGPGILSWLAARVGIVVAQAASPPGRPAVAFIAVSDAAIDALQAELADAHPGAGPLELNQLDGHAHDHPWALPNLARPKPNSAPDDSQVRVPVEILDRLFGRIGEFFNISSALNVLMVDSQVPSILQRLNDHILLKEPALLPALDVLQRQQAELGQIEAEVGRLVSLIHEATLGLRVIPLDILFNRYPRMIRELLREQGKQARFEISSDGIKVDKGMTELLADPLMHMLRNAVDHGIEPAEQRAALGKPPVARITLTATQNANRITVVIADDGRGINAELVRRHAVAQNLVTEHDSHQLSREQVHRFIFAPGFSTAERVTETSGRGVGMDVALVNISRLGGRIDIVTVPGQGTTFRLDMPLSAAMQTVLLAETAVQTVAFPERMVVEAVTIGRDSVQYVNGQRALLMHDRFLPLFRLTDLLRLPVGGEPGHEGQGPGDGSTGTPDGDISLIVVAADQARYGVEVNRILRRHEMLIRDTHPRIAQLPGIGGVSTLGADRIVLVIDPEGLTGLARDAALPGLRAAKTPIPLTTTMAAE